MSVSTDTKILIPSAAKQAVASIHPKVAAGTLAGAISTVVWGVVAETGMVMDPAISVGSTTILAFIIMWLVPANLWQKAGYNDSLPEEPQV